MPRKDPGLKPCPFCGGVARPVHSRVSSSAIGCTQCKAQGPPIKFVGHEFNEQEKAREAWNHRLVSEEARPAPSTDVPPMICSCCKQVVKESHIIRHEELKLRACPFCGSAAHTVAKETKGGLTCFIECEGCNARTRPLKGESEKGPVAIRKIAHVWNTRESDFEEAGQ